MLTTEEYKAIAADLTPATSAFIDGGFRPAISGKTFDSVNPATGDVIAQVAACGAEDVDAAVTKAREAFEDGRWSRLHPSDRKDVLIRLCKLMTRNARELAVLESVDSARRSLIARLSMCPRPFIASSGMRKPSTRFTIPLRPLRMITLPWWCASPWALSGWFCRGTSRC